MKTPSLLGVLVVWCVCVVGVQAATREAQWRAVDEATQQGQPRTAIAALEPIIAEALAEGAHAEAIRAIGRRIALEGTIQGNRPEEKIERLQAELETAPTAMRPVMEAILAHWTWHYFQRHRWQFHQRTQTAVAPGPDMRTWDLARILGEIDARFQAALADPAALQATPIAAFDALLERGTVPDTYRPTLYDFLTYEALQFYQAGEQGAVEAEDAFEIEAADTPIFGETAAFLRWDPPAADATAPALRAVRLLQGLLRFHADDADPSARYDAELARLTFGNNSAVGDDVPRLYRAALERFIRATEGHEIQARALAALAQQLIVEGELAAAYAHAARGLEAFPDAAGGAMCHNLIQQIEARSLRLDTERVWSEPWPVLRITHRNLTRVHLRAVAVDFEDHMRRSRWGMGGIDEARRRVLLAARPAHAWSVELSPTDDYKERSEETPVPGSLRPGYYAILASHDPEFRDADNQISGAYVWVSDLALVLQTRNDGRPQEGFVLQGRSGEPVSGAAVRLWRRDNEGRYRAAGRVTTDVNGRFQFATEATSVVVLAEHAGQAISSANEVWHQGVHGFEHASSQTVFFTDRALYRPGQSIHYKGVTLRYDQLAGAYSAFGRLDLIVVFNDTNGKEIARATHRTNDHGSFSGVFTAPRDRGTGRMTLQVFGHAGATTVSVEEYKRPKFQVALDAPVEAARLDAPVALTGRATAYSGAAIGGAKVRWRVERGVRLPPWCWWWAPPANKAIAHGSAVTAADGTFEVSFPATPDRDVPAANEPVFTYTIHADVTDIAGETRSTQRVVRAGYTALQATLAAAEWQVAETPVQFTVATRSLDDDPQAAAGTLTVHALRQPEQVARAPLQQGRPFWWGRRLAAPEVDPTQPDSWEAGERVAEVPFSTDDTGTVRLDVRLPAGIYRASLETQDRFGRKVTARHTVHVVAPDATHYAVKQPHRLVAPAWTVEPGGTFTALWGTGYDTGRAFVELECAGRILQSGWTSPDRTQVRIEQPMTEAMRGGVTLRVTYVRENRAYIEQRIIDVPWSNKQLALTWETFRSKLTPGQKETWTAVVRGDGAERVAAEMVAALYDASLDQFLPHAWPQAFHVFRREAMRGGVSFQNEGTTLHTLVRHWQVPHRAVTWRYRAFPQEIIANLWGWQHPAGMETRRVRGAAAASVGDDEVVTLSPFMVEGDAAEGYAAASTLAGTRLQTPLGDLAQSIHVVTGQFMQDTGATDAGGILRYKTETEVAGAPDLSQIAARRNLQETAFFFPHLTTGEDGAVRMEFTMPEALTEWRFLGFAHDRALRAGFLEGRAVTAKDLMVEPNPPRFVREGDVIEFSVKVSNQTDATQAGRVRLTFTDAATLQPVDATLGHAALEQDFEVPARESRSHAWRITVPDGMGFLAYRVVGASAEASDGEEGFLPVLSRRILVTESLPLPVRGRGTRDFAFDKLLGSGASGSLRHQSLTVQMVSQPAWYAVMALPYLMEFPHECSEQLFNRWYANTLARHIAGSDPRIRRIFDLWRDTPALDSPLEKNQDLKAVMIEETPWLRQAADESRARRQVGLLFDANRLDEESGRALRELAERQLEDGLWSWFPGGRPSEFISLYIATGFGRLRHLGAPIDVAPAVRALGALDAWMAENFRRITLRDDYVPSHLDALYLYGRSFFMAELPVAEPHREAFAFYQRQARRHWLKVDCRQCQAHLAIALHRLGDADTPHAIVRSIRERSVSDPELGMFWRDLELGWWWFRAPIETQAMMIELFAEVADDAEAVEACKVWLLKQKQTQDWKTTKATADAVYGLLLRGRDLLASDALVEVTLAGETIRPEKVEAGTGYYRHTIAGAVVRPELGRVTVRKTDDGVSWGSVHWQYLEDVARVTPHEATPLRLTKALFIKENTQRGPVLRPVDGPLAVGDELVVRIELRTDRDMEYVHLKDQRGSGTEPVNVLSGHRYGDGLAWYESTRDTASHFFIEYLPKGTYVFEYSTRVQLRGSYESGIATIQCMYAPEFTSHSASTRLEVR